jgi:hypothetical protein
MRVRRMSNLPKHADAMRQQHSSVCDVLNNQSDWENSPHNGKKCEGDMKMNTSKHTAQQATQTSMKGKKRLNIEVMTLPASDISGERAKAYHTPHGVIRRTGCWGAKNLVMLHPVVGYEAVGVPNVVVSMIYVGAADFIEAGIYSRWTHTTISSYKTIT